MLTLNMINYQDSSIAVKGAISHRNLHLRLPMTFVLIAKLIRTLSPSHSRHHNNIFSNIKCSVLTNPSFKFAACSTSDGWAKNYEKKRRNVV